MFIVPFRRGDIPVRVIWPLSQALAVDTEESGRGRRGRRTLLELGCGVGNAVFPLLEDNRGLYVVAVDLSSEGIELLKQHPMYR